MLVKSLKFMTPVLSGSDIGRLACRTFTEHYTPNHCLHADVWPALGFGEALGSVVDIKDKGINLRRGFQQLGLGQVRSDAELVQVLAEHLAKVRGVLADQPPARGIDLVDSPFFLSLPQSTRAAIRRQLTSQQAPGLQPGPAKVRKRDAKFFYKHQAVISLLNSSDAGGRLVRPSVI